MPFKSQARQIQSQLLDFSLAPLWLRALSGTISLLMLAFSCSAVELSLKLRQVLKQAEMSCDSVQNMWQP